MALKTDIRGMVWKYPDTFVVGREQVRQYATATKVVDPASYDEEAAAALGHDSLVAPLTFVSILANLIQRHFFQNVDVGIETMQIVQVDQKFHYLQPIKDGCRRTCTWCRSTSGSARTSWSPAMSAPAKRVRWCWRHTPR